MPLLSLQSSWSRLRRGLSTGRGCGQNPSQENRGKTVDVGPYLAILPNMQAKKSAAVFAEIHLQYRARAGVIKAMAHPTRLMIVDQLAREPQCVAALTAMAGVDMSTVSKHLTILKTAGIVQDEKRGIQVYYRLRMRCVMSFFECVDRVLEETALKQLELVRRQDPPGESK